MSHSSYGNRHESYQQAEKGMSPEIEASDILQELGGTLAFAGAGHVKAAIRNAATLTGLPFGRVRRLWYRQAQPRVAEMDLLRGKREAARAMREEARANEFRNRYETLMRENDALKGELATLRRRVAGGAGHVAV